VIIQKEKEMTKVKRAGGMAQEAELLLGKCEALSSNPSTSKKKKKRKKLWRVIEMFIILILVRVSWVHPYDKTQHPVYFKSVI
jgi:hypothetical protein